MEGQQCLNCNQVFQRPALVWEHQKRMPKLNPGWMEAAGPEAPPACPPARSPSFSPLSLALQPGRLSLRSQELPPDLKTPQTLHLVLVPLKLPFFHPSSKKSPRTKSVMTRAAHNPVLGPSPRKSQGEAGAQPRSITNKSNGTWAKMVTRGANPVTLEKRQKKSLFLCNIMVPAPSLPMQGALCSPQMQGALCGPQSWEQYLLSLLLVLSSFSPFLLFLISLN